VKPRRAAGVAPALLALALASGCATFAPERLVGPGWIELTSGGLAIVTNVGEPRARELASRLAWFRSILARHAGAPEQLPRVPTAIYVDTSFERFRDLIGRRRALGVFMPGVDGNQLALHDDGSGRGLEVLLHEYAHFLLRNQRRFHYPRWYHEGFAEFVAPVFSGDRPALGNLNRMRFRRGMRLLGLADLMREPPQRVDAGLFYGTAWLLVHYLHLSGADGGPQRLPQLRSYLKLCSEGATSEAAFAASFDVPLAALERELRAYARRDSFHRLVLEEQGAAADPPASLRALAPAEVAVRLGDVALAAREPKLAIAYHRAALGASEGDARALAGLGAAASQQLRHAEARGFYRRALAAGPVDARLLAAYAGALARRAERAGPAGAAERAEAQDLYRRAIALDPGSAAAHAGLGTSLLEQPAPDFAAAVAALERACEILASESAILYQLARAYVGVERFGEARRLLADVLAWEEHAGFGPEARALLRQIAALEAPRQLDNP